MQEQVPNPAQTRKWSSLPNWWWWW